MTRYIEKDKATQVKSSLIGVKVDVTPEPLWVTDTLYVDFSYEVIIGAGYVKYDSTSGEYNLDLDGIQLLVDQGNQMVFAFLGEFEYDSEGGYYWATLYRYEPLAGGIQEPYYVQTATDEGLTPADLIGYTVYEYDGETYSEYGTLDNVLDNTYSMVMSESGTLNTSYVVDNGWIYEDDTLTDVVGFVYGGSVETADNTKFNFNTLLGQQYRYTGYVYPQGNEQVVYVYTTVPPWAGSENDLLKSGDTVYRGVNQWWPLMVTDVINADDTPDPDPVDCSVAYSVDGKDPWTYWEENMTDDNNVIANIPRYMFLMFGQNVIITEE